MLGVVFLLLMVFASSYRREYLAFARKLLSAWFITTIIVVGATAIGSLIALGIGGMHSVLLVASAGLGTFVGFTDLIWITGPALWGIAKVLEGRGKYLAFICLVVFGLLGAGLVVWARRTAEEVQGPWSLTDTLLRVSALLCIVIVVISALSLATPLILNALEHFSFATFVGARHMRSKKSGFLTVISTLSILGVTLGSCSVSSAVSVMGGFREDLKHKILGHNAHIVIDVEAKTPIADSASVMAAAKQHPAVAGVTSVVHGECMISSASNLAGVIVRGIDPESTGQVTDLGSTIKLGKFDYLVHSEKLINLPPDEIIGFDRRGRPLTKGTSSLTLFEDGVLVTPQKPVRPGIIIGRELAKTIQAYIGDEVTLVSPLGDLGPMGLLPRTRKFRVAAVFHSGMYEYDATHVYTTLPTAQEYFQLGKSVSMIDIKVKDAETVEATSAELRKSVEGAGNLKTQNLRVRDWREINRNLFSALTLERYATMIVLSFIILVASFCIICTLLLMVTEKGREIAIMKAIGASDGDILKTFVVEGGIIGGIGTVFGISSALSLCLGIEKLGIRMDPEVYYIERLPVHVSGSDFAIIAFASFAICTLITVLPAWFAANLRPVEGLRHE
jgi:lipoprotein-releasing system permease protein